MAMVDAEYYKQELAEQKRRLQEIRAMYKPMVQRELFEHAINYEKMRQDREREIREKRKVEVAKERELKSRLPTYKSTRENSHDDDAIARMRKPGGILGAEL